MKGKRIFSILLSILLVVTLLPSVSIPARATQITTALDFVNTITSDSTGDGWSWNQAQSTLTLNGLDLSVASADDPIHLPAGAKINVTGNSTISSTNTAYIIVSGISGLDNLTINVDQGVTLTINVSGGATSGMQRYGIYLEDDNNGALTKTGKGTITITTGDCTGSSSRNTAVFCEKAFVMQDGVINANAGQAMLQGCGINADQFKMNGGNLNVTSTSTGTVNGGMLVSTFVFNGGEVDATGAVKAFISAPSPTITNYVYKSNASGGAFTGDWISPGTTPLTWTDKHVALKKLPTFTVTYDGNGNTSGSVPTDTGGYLSGATVTTKSNSGTLFIRNYTFAGWNTAADGTGTKYAVGDTFTITGNITLYAQWDYTLYFNPVDGKLYALYAAPTYSDEVTTLTGWSAGGSPGNHTLDLNNFSFTTSMGTALCLPSGGTINVTGNSTISNTSTTTSPNRGIYAEGNLTIDVASGVTLTVTSGRHSSVTNYAYGICATGRSFEKKGAGTLAVTGGGVGFTSDTGNIYGIDCADFTMSAGTLNAVATGGNHATRVRLAISSSGNFTMAGGTIFASINAAAVQGTSGAMKVTGTAPTNISINGKSASVYNVPASFVSGVIVTTTGSAPVGDAKITLTGDDSTQGPSGGSSSEESSSAPTTERKVPVIVDGKEVNIGTVTTKGDTTIVTVDQKALDTQITAAKDSVVIPVTTAADTNKVVAQLVVKNVEDIAAKDMTLSVQVGNISYDLPAAAIDTKALMEKFGTDDPAKVPVSIEIKTHVSAETQTQVETAAKKLGAEIVIPAVEFHITAAYEGKEVEVDTFDSYVGRTMEITPEQAKKITTAIVVNSNGTTRHVPTNVYKKDGKWYAEINSRTNSTYVFVYKDSRFTDISGKWYASFAKEVSERKIMVGFNKNSIFKGDSAITSAALMQVLVRSLGLPETGNTKVFKKINQKASYAGALGTAYEYGIITKKEAAAFNPTAKITRQDAMVYIQRAAKVLNYTGKNGKLAKYADGASVSAKNKAAVKFAIGSGLDTGTDGKWRPNAKLTRGETAAIAIKLLQKAKVIDVRIEE